MRFPSVALFLIGGAGFAANVVATNIPLLVSQAGDGSTSSCQASDAGDCLAGSSLEPIQGDIDGEEYPRFDNMRELVKKSWSELSEEERYKLVFREVQPEAWDRQPVLKRIYHFFWDEIGEEDQGHLKVLGWDSETWEAEQDDMVFYRPVTELRPWNRLSLNQRAAAAALGFAPSNWHVKEWEGDRPFNPVVYNFKIPELDRLNFDYLESLDVDARLTPDLGPAESDEIFEQYHFMPMKKYVDMLRKNETTLYLKYEESEQKRLSPTISDTITKNLREALSQTPLKDVAKIGKEFNLKECIYQNESDGCEFMDMASVYIGGANSISPVHIDHQTFNFIYVVEGRKRVILIPNDNTTDYLFHTAKETYFSVWPGVDVINGDIPPEAFEVILEAGQGIQIPYYMWHAVQNLAPTISYGLIRDFPQTWSTKRMPDHYTKGE
jgi:hypothetical protein